MNTEQLLNLVSSLNQIEQSQQIQQRLQELVNALNNLTSNPSEASFQTEMSARLKAFEETLDIVEAGFSPAYFKRLEGISAAPYFSNAMVRRIRQALAENGVTPATVRQEAQELLSQRANFIDNIASLEKSLSSIGFEDDKLKQGEAEIGFQIPRDIFENELGGLAKELNELKFIIRSFSELTGNTGEPIEVRTISTTDPLIFLGIAIPTIAAIGQAVKWCLDQWKTVEEIRKIRAETANLKNPALQKIADMYDEAIHQQIQESVGAEAKRLIADSNVAVDRQNEMQTYLEKSLQALLARVERGMTVEIRLLPPPADQDGEDKDAVAVAFQNLAEIQKQLAFPSPTGKPVLQLPKLPEDEAERKGD